MSRVYGAAATAILQADLSSIALYVYDRTTQEQVGVTLALTVSAVIFDTLQTDARWTKDATGYNFRTTISGATYFPDGDTSYRVEIIGTPVSGSTFLIAVLDVETLNRMSS